jgi:hypothetical protein
MRFLIDFRCPKCDTILRGEKEVVHRNKRPPKVIECLSCFTRVGRQEELTDLGNEIWYDFAPGSTLRSL